MRALTHFVASDEMNEPDLKASCRPWEEANGQLPGKDEEEMHEEYLNPFSHNAYETPAQGNEMTFPFVFLIFCFLMFGLVFFKLCQNKERPLDDLSTAAPYTLGSRGEKQKVRNFKNESHIFWNTTKLW